MQSELLCRICENRIFKKYLDLGVLALTGHFPEPGVPVQSSRLKLVQCSECNLVQLDRSLPLSAMYSSEYGYESHLNPSMANHLKGTARELEDKYLGTILNPRVLDIASNDGTLLSGYSDRIGSRIGIDPLISNFKNNYPENAILIEDFFGIGQNQDSIADCSVNIVTSLSVLYDVEKPITFAKEIWRILASNGIWYFEQSYLTSMIETVGYDTICHEHLLYLSATDILRICEKSGFHIEELVLNNVNGGSIAITARKMEGSLNQFPNIESLNSLIENEKKLGISNGTALKKFGEMAQQHRETLRKLIISKRDDGFKIYALGASTKGNVLLQYCALDFNLITAIGEINPRKFSKTTPSTCIPIVPEEEVFENLKYGKSFLLVLPWHFKSSIISKIKKLKFEHLEVIFPLPTIEIIEICNL